MNLNEIYEKEKILNSYFKQKYDYENKDIYNKQVLELLCELSEFAYETKCFKYWKNEKQSSADITIPEFADCLMIVLCFCDLASIEELTLETLKETDMVKLFIESNQLSSTLIDGLDNKKLLRILSILITISKLLNYSDEELSYYCNKKMDLTLSRIKEQ